jgi:isoquinoline 1-oxidoreductase alpha subunit
LVGVSFKSIEEVSRMAIEFNVNGKLHSVDVPEDKPLLWVLREDIGLTGTKYGCGIAQCGACTVQLDGRPMRSCTTPVSAVASRDVTTIEGVESPAAMAIRSAWRELDVVQCGYCQSGQMMSAAALLESNPSPSDDDIDRAMRGNICRCATYHRIRAAIHRAADELEA